MWYGILADVVVTVHLAYVLFVVVGLVAVVVGRLCGWEWVRNRWFRCIHLAMIAFVAFEVIIDMTCPLTTWENELRIAAGQPITGGTFVGRLMNNILFWNCPEWAQSTLFIGTALLVLSTFVFVPVRWRPRRGASPQPISTTCTSPGP
jgi:hypothetical protein